MMKRSLLALPLLCLFATHALAGGDFVAAGTDFYRSSSPSVTGYPFSVSVWVQPDTTADWRYTFVLADKDVDNNYFGVLARASNIAIFEARDASNNQNAVTGNSMAAGWNHICAIATSATSRKVILNGDTGNAGTNTTSITPAGIDRQSFGRLDRLTPGGYLDGIAAEVVLYSIALTDANCVSLSSQTPTCVAPASMLDYYPILDDAAESADIPSLLDDAGTANNMAAVLGQAQQLSSASHPTLSGCTPARRRIIMSKREDKARRLESLAQNPAHWFLSRAAFREQHP